MNRDEHDGPRSDIGSKYPHQVDLVPPHAIHAEQGGPTRSVAIIVRSQRLGEGTVLQHTYDPKAGTVIERYGPTQVPYELVA